MLSSLISETRESCKKSRIDSKIRISQPAIDSFLRSLSESDFNRLKSQHGVSFPLMFPSLVVEVNFLSVLSMLNTLSGYRLPFHQSTGVGAYQNIIKLLIGLYLSSPESKDPTSTGSLSSKGLKNLSSSTIAEILQVKLHVERPHESIPGLTVGIREGPMNEAVELIREACNQTGRLLEGKGYESLGSFVIETLKGSEKVKEETGNHEKASDYLLEKLISFIPAFDDRYTIPETQPIYIFKKAFFLQFALYQRLIFKKVKKDSKSPDLFVPNPESLPIFCDNVIPSMLHHLGILNLKECNSETLKGWKRMEQGDGKVGDKVDGPMLSKLEAYLVRAGAVDAGLEIKNRAWELAGKEQDMKWLEGVTEADIDGYLWSAAKADPLLRAVPRMVERNTIMY